MVAPRDRLAPDDKTMTLRMQSEEPDQVGAALRPLFGSRM
jgi:hypothetical protein